jgi:uncharacterized iron-regulated membrane protein
MTASAWRRYAVRIHLLAGLVTAPLLLVLGLSGTVLVFRTELEEAVNGPGAVAEQGGTPRSLDAIVAAARLGHAGGEPRAVRIPARPDRPYRVELDARGRRVDVAVDPYTLRIVASRGADRSPLLAVHSLHAALHAGRPGALVVAVLGVCLTLEAVTGLWLYGPALRRAASGDRRRLSTRTLHRVAGVLALVGGVVIGLTGAVLAGAGAWAVAVVPPAAPAFPGPPLPRLDAVAAAAAAARPHARINALVAEAAGTVRVEIGASRPGGADGPGVVRVGRDGAVVAVTAGSPRHDAWDVLRRLHAGDFGGGVGRIAYATVGLALPVLSITGFVIAIRRRAGPVVSGRVL